jgi:hypothetical protein
MIARPFKGAWSQIRRIAWCLRACQTSLTPRRMRRALSALPLPPGLILTHISGWEPGRLARVRDFCPHSKGRQELPFPGRRGKVR